MVGTSWNGLRLGLKVCLAIHKCIVMALIYQRLDRLGINELVDAL